MRVANAALAANFLVNRIVMAASVFDFGNIKLSFQCPFNFEFDSIKFSFSISCLEDFSRKTWRRAFHRGSFLLALSSCIASNNIADVRGCFKTSHVFHLHCMS